MPLRSLLHRQESTMADILPDHAIQRLLGHSLVHGDIDCVKANTYELRLGAKARFRNTDERVELKDGEYLEVAAGEIVDLTSYEVIDFRAETVDEVFPGKSLMGLLTTRTTLMREGISFTSTKIDPGWLGTLDWVFKNHDFRPVLLPYKERLVNMIIFQLQAGERPDYEYGKRATDSYQGSSGLQPTARHIPAQIPDGLIKRQSKKPEDAAKRIRDYGPPLSWVGTEIEALTEHFHNLSGKVDGFLPKIEHLISSRFNRTYAFILGVALLVIALIQFLRAYEYLWIPWLLGGLSILLLIVALLWRSNRKG